MMKLLENQIIFINLAMFLFLKIDGNLTEKFEN